MIKESFASVPAEAVVRTTRPRIQAATWNGVRFIQPHNNAVISKKNHLIKAALRATALTERE